MTYHYPYPLNWSPPVFLTCPNGASPVDLLISWYRNGVIHDDVIKWKHFPRYWPFERGIHRSPVNSPHKGQWREALVFSLICVWINGWVNNREAGVFETLSCPSWRHCNVLKFWSGPFLEFYSSLRFQLRWMWIRFLWYVLHLIYRICMFEKLLWKWSRESLSEDMLITLVVSVIISTKQLVPLQWRQVSVIGWQLSAIWLFWQWLGVVQIYPNQCWSSAQESRPCLSSCFYNELSIFPAVFSAKYTLEC